MQGEMFGGPPDERFDGDDYDDKRDRPRLRGQLRRIWDEVRSGEWYTLGEIASRTGDPEASISAQLRHLRKPRFGKHDVEKRHRGDESRGLYEYRLTINPEGLPEEEAPSE